MRPGDSSLRIFMGPAPISSAPGRRIWHPENPMYVWEGFMGCKMHVMKCEGRSEPVPNVFFGI